MIQILFILICLLSYQITTAQTSYVVTSTGDTIKGKVKYLDYDIEKKVQITTDNKKTVYPILQILAFSIDNEIYHPIRSPQGYTYMKVLKSGYLSLYAFQLENQTRWDGRYLTKKDGKGIEVPNLAFKKNLNKFLIECPTVTSQIESGELSKKEIDKIVDAYNQCINLNTQKQNQGAKEQQDKLGTWIQLETSVKNLPDFAQRQDVLEMIQDIKEKISKGEKVPNFLSEGLKEALKEKSEVQELLEKALKELN